MSCQNQDCRHGTGWGKFLNHYSGKLGSTASLSEILGVVLPKPSFASMAIFVLYQINSGLMSWKSVICDWVTNHSTVKPWQTDFQSSLWLQDWISLPCDLIKNHYWIFMIFFKLLLKFISTYTEHELLILYSKSNMRAKLEAYKTWFPNKWSWSNMPLEVPLHWNFCSGYRKPLPQYRPWWWGSLGSPHVLSCPNSSRVACLLGSLKLHPLLRFFPTPPPTQRTGSSSSPGSSCVTLTPIGAAPRGSIALSQPRTTPGKSSEVPSGEGFPAIPPAVWGRAHWPLKQGTAGSDVCTSTS